MNSFTIAVVLLAAVAQTKADPVVRAEIDASGAVSHTPQVQRHGRLMRSDSDNKDSLFEGPNARKPPARKFGTKAEASSLLQMKPGILSEQDNVPRNYTSDPLKDSKGNDIDPLCKDKISAHTMCKILDGTNAEVAHKLEQSIQAFNIEDHGVSTVVTIDNDEEVQMKALREALWTLYFCSKQESPKCEPKISEDEQVQEARTRARVGLTAIQYDDGEQKSEGLKAYRKALEKLNVPAVLGDDDDDTDDKTEAAIDNFEFDHDGYWSNRGVATGGVSAPACENCAQKCVSAGADCVGFDCADAADACFLYASFGTSESGAGNRAYKRKEAATIAEPTTEAPTTGEPTTADPA